MSSTATLEAMIATLSTALPTGVTGSGEPQRRLTKIVNGKRVFAYIIGWDERVVFEVSTTGTKPLTLEEAAEEVAA